MKDLDIKFSAPMAIAARALQPTAEVGRENEFETMPDLETYVQQMALAVGDKVDHIDRHFSQYHDIDVVIDFGCADGTMLRYFQTQYPHLTCIGYDIAPEMVRLAQQKNREVGMGDMLVTMHWDEVQAWLDQMHREGKKAVLVLSSVLHEVFHYLPKEKEVEFWDRVWNSGFDSVAIRDMMVSEKLEQKASHADDVAKVRARFEEEPEKHAEWTRKIGQWEELWGPLENKKSLVHFLMTYPYESNWERELREDYFPISLERLQASIPANYEVTEFQQYLLEYRKKEVAKDFGFTLDEPTHIKLVLRKVELAKERGQPSLGLH